MVKSIILFHFLIISTSFVALAQIDKAIPLNIDSIPETVRKDVVSFGERIINGMDSKKYYIPTQEEATSDFLNKFTAEAQEKFYQERKMGMGEYAGDIKLAEVYNVTFENGKEMIFYRLKANFFHNTSLKKKEGEIRLIYENNLLNGFTIAPWFSF